MFPDPPSSTILSTGASIRKPEPLVSGCKQIDEFGDEGDYEEEEESFVTLDLGSVDQALVPSSSTYRLVGLDTVTPYLQLSGTIMRGHVQTLLGTEMLFKETEESPTNGSPRRSYGPVHFQTLTNKRIAFRELDIRPKLPTTADNTDAIVSEDQDQDASMSSVVGKGKNKASKMLAEAASRSLLYPDGIDPTAGSTSLSFLPAEIGDPSGNGFGMQGDDPMAVDGEAEVSSSMLSLGGVEAVDDGSWLDPALTN